MYSDPHEEIKEPTRISALEHEQTFAGKTVIVTGASSGIGRAVSKRLILRGITNPLVF
jgi:FlaA1/EpsC-like NDP-sugar epimerase